MKSKHTKITIPHIANFSSLDKKNTIVITDENVFAHHSKKLKDYSTIVLKAGEAFKVQATIDSIVEQLLHYGANKTTTLVGVGGGVITDIIGYVASIYMRGINFGFVPTSQLKGKMVQVIHLPAPVRKALSVVYRFEYDNIEVTDDGV